MKQPTQPPSPLYARGRVRWHNLLTVLIICRARADTDAAHRIQIEKLEDQVRSATEFKVCTPNKRKCYGKRRGGGEGEGEGVRGRGRGRGPRESGLSSINTSFIRTYYPTGPGSPLHFIKASS